MGIVSNLILGAMFLGTIIVTGMVAWTIIAAVAQVIVKLDRKLRR
jgi:hypothetical protein